MASSIITLADAETVINSVPSQTAELQTFVDAVHAIAKKRLVCVLDETCTDRQDGGTSTLFLRRFPLTAVTSVTEYQGTTAVVLAREELGSSSYTAAGYRLNTDTGEMTRTNGGSPTCFAAGARNLVIVYTAGMATVPADISRGALELLRHMWETQRGTGTTRPVAGLDPDFAAPAASSAYTLPNRVKEAWQPWLRWDRS